MKLFLPIQHPVTGEATLVEAEGTDYAEARFHLAWLLDCLSHENGSEELPITGPEQ